MRTFNLLCITIIFLIFGSLVTFADTPVIVLDGSELEFDVPPIIESGRTLVPLRSLFESMGATVTYDPVPRTIQINLHSTRIVLRIDSTIVWLNGTPVQLDVPARVVNGRTLIPLRFVGESLGLEVLWLGESRTIYLESNINEPVSKLQDFLDEDGLHRYYRWQYRNTDQITEIILDPVLVEYYQNHDRIPSDDYSIYVTNPYDDSTLESIAVQFRKEAQARDMSEQELINYVITFVQYLEYQIDEDANGVDEYPQYPLETLYVKSGDCEDTSILLAALLKSLNHDPIIIHYPGIHTAVGLEMTSDTSLLRYYYNNRNYTYIETTRPYQIGRIPEEFLETGAVMFNIVPAPAVRYEWLSDADGIEIRVWNYGTGPAKSLQVQVQLEGRDGEIYYSTASLSERLNPDDYTDVWLKLKYPLDTKMRIKVAVYNAGKLMAESRSKWFGDE